MNLYSSTALWGISLTTNPPPILVEQDYDAPIETVWSAITDEDQMRIWFFDTMLNFQPVVDFETTFHVECDGRDFLHVWKVVKVEPLEHIAYDWRYEGIPGLSTVFWDLSKTESGTLLKLAHQEREPFPQDDPIFTREACESGWDYILRDQLKNFLAE